MPRKPVDKANYIKFVDLGEKQIEEIKTILAYDAPERKEAIKLTNATRAKEGMKLFDFTSYVKELFPKPVVENPKVKKLKEQFPNLFK